MKLIKLFLNVVQIKDYYEQLDITRTDQTS